MKKSNLETLRQSVDDLKKDKDIMEQTSSEEIDQLNSKNKKLTTLIENVDDRLEGLDKELVKFTEFIKLKNDNDEEAARCVLVIKQDIDNMKRKTNADIELTKPPTNCWLCKICDIDFKSKDNLLYHKKTRHPKNIKCNHCGDIFDENWKLEKHMDSHHVPRQFKCEKCDKAFHLQWRLTKHMEIRSENVNPLKTCHYFNNGKACPFQSIGCKFLHKKADLCPMSSRCHFSRCQYRHS